MADFGPNKVFCPNFQIAISEILGTKISEFSYFNDTYKWSKSEEIVTGKGVKFWKNWMIWHGIALTSVEVKYLQRIMQSKFRPETRFFVVFSSFVH